MNKILIQFSLSAPFYPRYASTDKYGNSSGVYLFLVMARSVESSRLTVVIMQPYVVVLNEDHGQSSQGVGQTVPSTPWAIVPKGLIISSLIQLIP